MRDRTIQYSRVTEIVTKWAQQAEEQPLHADEKLRRKERVRRILGTMLGAGYGTLAGGFVGGQVLGRGPGFDRQRAVKGMLLGLIGGGSLGYAGGAAVNKIQRYTGDHRPQPQSQTIQIIVPPDSNIVQRAADAMDDGQGSKTAAVLRKRFRRFLSSV
jgi:hypothetical protein